MECALLVPGGAQGEGGIMKVWEKPLASYPGLQVLSPTLSIRERPVPQKIQPCAEHKDQELGMLSL